MQDFKDKTAVITGGASGIGLALGELFARQGMNIVLADIEQQSLDTAVARLQTQGAACIGVITDVSRADAVEQLAERAMTAFGGIHIACNNAGVFAGGLLLLQDSHRAGHAEVGDGRASICAKQQVLGTPFHADDLLAARFFCQGCGNRPA